MTQKYRALLPAVLMSGLMLCLSLPAGAFELFPRPERQVTVQRGDTLYSLAADYYSNPALWNFLWNQNPSIRIPPGTKSPDTAKLVPGMTLDLYHQLYPYTILNEDYNAPTGVPEEVRFMIADPPLKGIPYDKRYFRYKLAPRPTQIWGYIISSPDDAKMNYLERDLVYIRFRPAKRQCILVGDRFGIYRERGPLYHPLNLERSVGQFGDVVGEVEVVSTGNSLVTAIILDSFEEISRGDKVCLFTPRPRQIVPTKTHRMLTGTILRAASQNSWQLNAYSLENDVVFINRGECEGMKEGLLVNIYRPSHPVQDPYTFRRINTPDRHIGEGMVLKAFESNSTLIITKSREEVLPGDIIKSVSD